MKKTLMTVAFAAACSAVAAAATVSNNTAATQSGGYTAFDFTLNSSSWLTPAGVDLTENSGDVTLRSITLDMFGTWYNNGTDKGTGIALFKKVDSTWNYVAKSDWQTVTISRNGNKEVEFGFGDITLNAATTYTAVFYGNEMAFNELSTTSTLSSLAAPSTAVAQAPTYENPIVAAGLHTTSITNGEGLYQWNATEITNYAPKVTFAVNIPEPATATLSLLALAGLAARRRRK